MFSVAFVIFATLAGRSAQATIQQIYSSSKPLTEQNLELKRWGGGSIVESGKVVYQGKRALSIESRNYFQGGMLAFPKPLDWSSARKDSSNELRFTFFVQNPNSVIQKTSKNVVLRTRTHDQHVANRQVRTIVKPKVKQLRIVVTTTDAKKSEFYIPVDASQPTTKSGWRTIAVPLQSIHGFGVSNQTVSGLTLSTDNISTLYIDDVRIVTDEVPLTGEAKPASAELHAGDQLTFSAVADGGLSPIVFRWDFGEDSNGLQIDAEGARVRHRFKKAGNYKVTLTIADRFGYKKPYQQVIPVTVTP